jgi:4-hydroxy-tetrahydrodipicolinate synthase
MVRAGLKFDFSTAKKLNDPLLEVYNLLFAENNPAGVKGFLSAQGVIKNITRLPVTPLSDGVYKKAAAYVKNNG